MPTLGGGVIFFYSLPGCMDKVLGYGNEQNCLCSQEVHSFAEEPDV